ncbi:MAG: hypothetical protein R3F07_01730 [Opitutaceae bacterium]
MTENGILLTDLSRCEPGGALSRQRKQGHWRLVDYETVDGVRGQMVFADPELGAPELTLRLGLTGPHRVFLGINYSKSSYGDRLHYLEWSLYGQLEVRLSDDPGFTRVAAEQGALDEGEATGKMGKGKLINRSIQESYWKTADLTGQDLVFRLPGPPYNREELRDIANLTWVRLEPLTRDEIERWNQWQPTGQTHCGAFIYCSGILTGHIRGTFDFHPTSEDWFAHEIQPCLDSDLSVFIFEAVRGHLCAYRTRIGDVGTEDNSWPEGWIDPLDAFSRACRRHGLKIMASLRMIGANYPMQRYPISWSRHFFAHPEWVKRDREGNPTTSLSLAFPEVRRYWLSLLRETLERDIDGVVLYFHRFHPFVLYEEPVVAAFRDRYGEDPRQLPEDDPRWIGHCAGYVTQFVREARQLVNEFSGRTLGVTFFGCPTRYDRRFKDEKDFGSTRHQPIPGGFDPVVYTCDVKTWVREGLVDSVYPMGHVDPELISALRAIGGAGLSIWPDLMPRAQPGAAFVRLARSYYEAGADGYCLNDAERRTPRLSEWAVQRRLGHRDRLNQLEEEAPTLYRRHELKTLMGYATRYSFNNFG